MLILLQDATVLQDTTGPGGLAPPEQSLLTVPQLAVVAFLLVSIILIATLLIRTGIGRSTLPQGERSWLDYGNLYVAALGIAAVIIGFLVILLFLDHFADGTQALGFLTALFGAIVGLVGTYFGVKQSADAREGAESATTLAAGVGSKVPTVTITPANTTVGRGADHTVTATVISVDGFPAAGIPVTFTVTAGPDATTTSTELTDASGQARFTFTNNGTAGNDTIEATALEGKGTATVTFT